MIYTAMLAKKADPDCVTVFVGPCLAKKREGMDSDTVDYVLTVDEISSLFAAKKNQKNTFLQFPAEILQKLAALHRA